MRGTLTAGRERWRRVEEDSLKENIWPVWINNEKGERERVKDEGHRLALESYLKAPDPSCVLLRERLIMATDGGVIAEASIVSSAWAIFHLPSRGLIHSQPDATSLFLR